MTKIKFFAVCMLWTLSTLVFGQNQTKFDYLHINGNKVQSSHRLPAVLNVPDDYRLLGEYEFIQGFDDNLFNVSTATFLNDSALLIIHAEEYTHGDKTFDYSELPEDTLNGIQCYRRTGCFNLFEETEQSIAENEYLAFLKSTGFNFNQGLDMVQFLLLNKGKTAEIVLSYAKILNSCPDKPETENSRALQNTAKQAFRTFKIKSY